MASAPDKFRWPAHCRFQASILPSGPIGAIYDSGWLECRVDHVPDSIRYIGYRTCENTFDTLHPVDMTVNNTKPDEPNRSDYGTIAVDEVGDNVDTSYCTEYTLPDYPTISDYLTYPYRCGFWPSFNENGVDFLVQGCRVFYSRHMPSLWLGIRNNDHQHLHWHQRPPP